MSMVGANADALDQAAKMLNDAADQLDADSARLHSTLRGVSWLGAVATAFTHLFEGDHQPRLHSSANFIRDAARKLSANAAQQRQASASGAPAREVWTTMPFIPKIVPGPGLITPGIHLNPTPDQPTPFKDMFNQSENDLRNGFKGDWHEGRNKGFDQWNFTYGGPGDCTSYVAWRLNQLAAAEGLTRKDGPYFTNNHLGDHELDVFGGAGAWGPSAQNKLHMPPDDIPRPGAVAWWSDSSPYGGHVAIVRSVNPDGSITIEESSAGKNPFDFRIRTIHLNDPKERALLPTGFLHLLPNT